MKKSFLFAFKGFMACYRTERNFRIHIAVAFYALVGAAIVGFSEIEWILVLLCVGAVTGAEIFNTAIEKLCDALHPNRSRVIGLVKDMTAGAVLMFSVASAIIGAILFFRPAQLAAALAFITTRPVWTVLIAVTILPALWLIFRRYSNDNKNNHDHDSGASECR